MSPRNLAPLIVLLPLLTSSGCGAGGAARANDTATSPGPATSPIPSAAAPHRRTHPSPSARAAAPNRVAPPGSYDDTSGTTNGTPRTQTAVLTHLPGSAVARCVDVGAGHDVRSGALAMGDFAAARATYARTQGAYDAAPTHLYVIPRSRAVRSASVTLSLIGGGATPIRIRSAHAATAAQWRFFPIEVAITRPGTWRIRVVAGAEHGCFVTTFRS